MNILARQTLRKIANLYFAYHDAGPEAPVNWQVMALVEIIESMDARIDELEERVNKLAGMSK